MLQRTLTPSCANRMAPASPLPTPRPHEPAPVTIATLPRRRSAITSYAWGICRGAGRSRRMKRSKPAFISGSCAERNPT